MPLDTTPISGITPTTRGDRLRISWTSSAPAGSTYQVYLDRARVWSGQATSCNLPLPAAPVSIEVGVVGLGESQVDFSASLPAAPATRAVLAWQGGNYQSGPPTRFAVFGSLAPGQPVSYAATLGQLPAYDAGIETDGYGMGGYGAGGFGVAGQDYSWTSGPLAPGVWSFAVLAYDDSGNASTAATATVTVAGPPNPPARNADGARLTYAYDQPSRVATLNWLASPA